MDAAKQLKKSWDTGSKAFRFVAFLVCIFLIVNGSMLVYECQTNSSADVTENIGLVVVGSIALGLTAILLCYLVWIARKRKPEEYGWGLLYIMTFVVMFGAAVGTLSIVNGVDVPNDSSRATIGWVLGGITTGVAVLGTVAIIYYWWTVWGNPKYQKYLDKQYDADYPEDDETPAEQEKRELQEATEKLEKARLAEKAAQQAELEHQQRDADLRAIRGAPPSGRGRQLGLKPQATQ